MAVVVTVTGEHVFAAVVVRIRCDNEGPTLLRLKVVEGGRGLSIGAMFVITLA